MVLSPNLILIYRLLQMNKKTNETHFTLLSLIYLTIMVSSTSVAYKPVEIGSVTATASSLLFAFTFAISSIIAEVYGRERSMKLINQIIPCGLLFTIIITLMIHLPSPSNWHHEADYSYVFGNSFRFAFFGTIGCWIAYRINTTLITKWQVLTRGRYAPLRIIGANTIGEFFLVLITTFGAFYSVFPLKDVISMFLFAYFSKILFAFILSWPSAFVAVIIKGNELSNNHEK